MHRDAVKRPGGVQIAFQHAKPLHFAHNIVLLNDTDAVDPPLRLDLHHIDGDTGLAESDGGA